jgi:hypothetical protein
MRIPDQNCVHAVLIRLLRRERGPAASRMLIPLPNANRIFLIVSMPSISRHPPRKIFSPYGRRLFPVTLRAEFSPFRPRGDWREKLLDPPKRPEYRVYINNQGKSGCSARWGF